jgi:hypothetical protein
MKNISGKFIGLKPKLNKPVSYFFYIGDKIFFLINTLVKK